MHRFLISVILFSSSYVLAQDSKRLYQTKKMATNKTIVLDSLSINPSYFKIVDSNGVSVDTASYYMDFKKAVLNFKNTLSLTDSIEVTYLKYPEFLTKTYKQIALTYGNINSIRTVANAIGKNPILLFIIYERYNRSNFYWH